MAKAAAKTAKSDVCRECGGSKLGRGFAHKSNCSLATGKAAGTGERMEALVSRLSSDERDIAKTLAAENTRDVLRYAASMAKATPKRVDTDTMFDAMRAAGVTGDMVAKIRAALIAQ